MAHETVLVVDDSPDVAGLLEEVLSALGFKVVIATDGAAGMQAAVTGEPDLIMLDMNMPRMSGMEVLVALRRSQCRAPVIFMTAFGSVSVAVEAFRLGVRDYLSKPFDVRELEQAIARALNESRLARENEQLNRDLIAAETVRQTVVTLSHYINNHLMVVEHGLSLIEECPPLDGAALRDTMNASHEGLRQIAAVIRVLQNITRVNPTPYHADTMMLDIEAALRAESQRQQGRGK